LAGQVQRAARRVQGREAEAPHVNRVVSTFVMNSSSSKFRNVASSVGPLQSAILASDAGGVGARKDSIALTRRNPPWQTLLRPSPLASTLGIGTALYAERLNGLPWMSTRQRELHEDAIHDGGGTALSRAFNSNSAKSRRWLPSALSKRWTDMYGIENAEARGQSAAAGSPTEAQGDGGRKHSPTGTRTMEGNGRI